MTLERFQTAPTKIATIVAFSMDAVRFGRLEFIISRSVEANSRAINTGYLGDAAGTDAQPAGILNGALGFVGGSPSGLEPQVEQLYGYVVNGRALKPIFVTSGRGVMHLASTGLQIFKDVKFSGGSICGARLLVAPEAGNKLILFDANEIAYFDGGLEIVRSDIADVQMSDSPTNGAAAVVSAFLVNHGPCQVRAAHPLDQTARRRGRLHRTRLRRVTSMTTVKEEFTKQELDHARRLDVALEDRIAGHSTRDRPERLGSCCQERRRWKELPMSFTRDDAIAVAMLVVDALYPDGDAEDIARLKALITAEPDRRLAKDKQPEQMTPRNAAAWLVASLEARGAVFHLDDDNFFRCDLDPIADMKFDEADSTSKLLLSLKDEVRAELVARRTTH